MKLLTKEVLRRLAPIGSEAPNAVVKFFTPWTNWTWWASEYDPEERLFFGLVDGFCKELGYFSLDELESVRGPGGLRIERDLYFKPTPLKDLMNGGDQ